MNLHERTLLAHAAERHARLIVEADRHRALRTLHARPSMVRLRSRVAGTLRAVAARIDPSGHGRLA